MKKKLLDIAMESVHFQSLQFFRELTLQFEELKKLKAKEIPDSPIAKTLTDVVKTYTGLSITFAFPVTSPVGPHVEVPTINRNHPLANPLLRQHMSSASGLRLIEEADGVLQGGVNLITGRVEGAFANIDHMLTIPVTSITGTGKDALIPEELAAIALHEVGHLFTHYEFISRVATTNQILAGLEKEMEGNDATKRQAALVTIKKRAGLSDLDVEALSKASNATVELVVVSNIVQKAESELGRNIYDMSTWEMLADQYAARYGAARYLATGLDKIYRGSWNISFRSLPAYLAFEAIKLLSLFWLPRLALFLISMDGRGDGTYDTPGARLMRVRSQVVKNLEDRDLSKDDVARLQADLKVIDGLLSDIKDRRQFVEVVWDFLIPGARKDRNYIQLQKDLEEIAANDLFVKAASLKQLTA